MSSEELVLCALIRERSSVLAFSKLSVSRGITGLSAASVLSLNLTYGVYTIVRAWPEVCSAKMSGPVSGRSLVPSPALTCLISFPPKYDFSCLFFPPKIL